MPNKDFVFKGCFEDPSSTALQEIKKSIIETLSLLTKPENCPVIVGVDLEAQKISDLHINPEDGPVAVVVINPSSQDTNQDKKLKKALSAHPKVDQIVSIAFHSSASDIAYVIDQSTEYCKALTELHTCHFLPVEEKDKIISALQEQKSALLQKRYNYPVLMKQTREFISHFLQLRLRQIFVEHLRNSNSDTVILNKLLDDKYSAYNDSYRKLREGTYDYNVYSRRMKATRATGVWTLLFLVASLIVGLFTCFINLFLCLPVTLALLQLAFMPPESLINDLLKSSVVKNTETLTDKCSEATKKPVNTKINFAELLEAAIQYEDDVLIRELINQGAKPTGEMLSYAIKNGLVKSMTTLLDAHAPLSSWEDVFFIYQHLEVWQKANPGLSVYALLENSLIRSLNDGREIFLRSDLTNETASMTDGFLFNETKKELYYIDYRGKIEKLKIDDVKQFSSEIAQVKCRQEEGGYCHFKDKLPPTDCKYDYLNSYIYVENSNKKTLYYISPRGAEKIKFNNPALFDFKINAIRQPWQQKIHLNREEVEEYITKNSGFDPANRLFLTIRDIEKMITANGGFTLENQSALLEKSALVARITRPSLEFIFDKIKKFYFYSFFANVLANLRKEKLQAEVAKTAKFLSDTIIDERSCTVLFSDKLPEQKSLRCDFILTKPDKEAPIKLYAADRKSNIKEVKINNYPAINDFVSKLRADLNTISPEKNEQTGIRLKIIDVSTFSYQIEFEGQKEEGIVDIAMIDKLLPPIPLTQEWLDINDVQMAIFALLEKEKKHLPTYTHQVKLDAVQVHELITKYTDYCWEPIPLASLPLDVVPAITSFLYSQTGISFFQAEKIAERAVFPHSRLQDILSSTPLGNK